MQRNPKVTSLSSFCRGLAGRWPWWPPLLSATLSSRGQRVVIGGGMEEPMSLRGFACCPLALGLRRALPRQPASPARNHWL